MRHITEQNAKVIEQAVESRLQELQNKRQAGDNSLRLVNQIRLLHIAQQQLITSKTINNKNGKANN